MTKEKEEKVLNEETPVKKKRKRKRKKKTTENIVVKEEKKETKKTTKVENKEHVEIKPNKETIIVEENIEEKTKKEYKKEKQVEEKEPNTIYKEEVKEVAHEDIITETEIKKHYFGYKERLSVLIVLFTLTIVVIGIFFKDLIDINKKDEVTFIEQGSSVYNINLKENSIYDSKIISEDLNYSIISELVDTIDVTYDYKINSMKNLTGDVRYKIVGELKLINPKDNKLYLTKTYELSEQRVYGLKDKNKFNINNSISFNYSKYNDIANKLKKEYGVDTKGEFDLNLVVDKSDLSVNSNKPSSKVILKMTLGEQNTKITKENLDETNIVNVVRTDTKQNKTLRFLVSVLLLLAVYIFIKINKLILLLQPKISNYDKELTKILKEYDRAIVNVSVLPDFNEYKKVKIDSFKELLDAKDNFCEPIRFVEVAPHTKSYFFVKHQDEIFVYTLKDTNNER